MLFHYAKKAIALAGYHNAIAEGIANLLLKQECEWVNDEEKKEWLTNCGYAIQFPRGNPDKHHSFCTCCGRRIKIK